MLELCFQNSQPLWDEGAPNYVDYDMSYFHGNIENQDNGGTNNSDTTLDQPEAQNIPTPVEARNLGHGLLPITEGNENAISGEVLTRPFSQS